MRVSYSHEFILLHVPRTGVSSIIAALDDGLFLRARPTRWNKLLSKYLYRLPRPPERTCFRAHETAAHVRRLMPAAQFDRFCRIAFVRNPYSWLVSLYELFLQNPSHRHHARAVALGDFGRYIDWEIARNKRHQHRYLCDSAGALLVDRIGRFERLERDAARIFAELGVPIDPLPRVGRFTRRDYRAFYDSSSRRKVAEHWARDLDLLGYDFEGPVDVAGDPADPY